jgi:hypothetical protein
MVNHEQSLAVAAPPPTVSATRICDSELAYLQQVGKRATDAIAAATLAVAIRDQFVEHLASTYKCGPQDQLNIDTGVIVRKDQIDG